MNKTLAALSVGAFLATTGSAPADIYYFEVPLDGGQEFPGPGDPDGTGLAMLWFDSVNGLVTWDISVNDIGLLTADHIHEGAAGVAGPVRINFGGSLIGGPLFDADVSLLLADPTQYYVNVHNADFPAGAIRGQLPAVPTAVIPEGSTWLAMLGVAGAGWMRWHRRRSATPTDSPK